MTPMEHVLGLWKAAIVEAESAEIEAWACLPVSLFRRFLDDQCREPSWVLRTMDTHRVEVVRGLSVVRVAEGSPAVFVVVRAMWPVSVRPFVLPHRPEADLVVASLRDWRVTCPECGALPDRECTTYGVSLRLGFGGTDADGQTGEASSGLMVHRARRAVTP